MGSIVLRGTGQKIIYLDEDFAESFDLVEGRANILPVDNIFQFLEPVCKNSELILQKNKEIWKKIKASLPEIGEFPLAGTFVHKIPLESIGISSGIYSGQLSQGSTSLEGYGILKVMNTKIKYVGSFKDNQFSGEGLLKFSKHHFYFGSFRENLYHGFGRYQSGEDSYEGLWENGRKNGEGKELVRGFTYKGSFSDGKRHGKGRCKSGDFSFKGSFDNNRFRLGRYTSLSESFWYEGSWSHNRPHGGGKLKMINSEGTENIVLKGEFRAGKMRNGSISFGDCECFYLQKTNDSEDEYFEVVSGN